MKRALVLCSLVATCLVLAGTALEAANDPRAMQLTYQPWTKTCLGDSNCFVAVEARGQCHPSGGAITIALPDSKNGSLSAHFGTKRALEGAISVQIDQYTPIILSDQRCYASGCSGRTAIEGGVVERLKRSQTINIEATDAAHQKLRLSFSLADFSKAYEGPGTEPKVFEESQEELKELLRQRAEKGQPPPQCDD